MARNVMYTCDGCGVVHACADDGSYSAVMKLGWYFWRVMGVPEPCERLFCPTCHARVIAPIATDARRAPQVGDFVGGIGATRRIAEVTGASGGARWAVQLDGGQSVVVEPHPDHPATVNFWRALGWALHCDAPE